MISRSPEDFPEGVGWTVCWSREDYRRPGENICSTDPQAGTHMLDSGFPLRFLELDYFYIWRVHGRVKNKLKI